jgi:hypothetical protein
LTNSKVGNIRSSCALDGVTLIKSALDLTTINAQVGRKRVLDTTANLTALDFIGLNGTSDINKGLEVGRSIRIVASLSDHSNNDNEASERLVGGKIVGNVGLSDDTRVEVMDNFRDLANILDSVSGPGLRPPTVLTSTEDRTSLTAKSEGLTTACAETVGESAITAFSALEATTASTARVADGVSRSTGFRRRDNNRLSTIASSCRKTAFMMAPELKFVGTINGVDLTAATPRGSKVSTLAVSATGVSSALTANIGGAIGVGNNDSGSNNWLNWPNGRFAISGVSNSAAFTLTESSNALFANSSNGMTAPSTNGEVAEVATINSTANRATTVPGAGSSVRGNMGSFSDNRSIESGGNRAIAHVDHLTMLTCAERSDVFSVKGRPGLAGSGGGRAVDTRDNAETTVRVAVASGASGEVKALGRDK